MRLIGTAAVLCISTVASGQDPRASATARDFSTLEPHLEVDAVRATDVISTAATRRHDRDFREDSLAAGHECVPSPLWAKEVDPTEYEIGCVEIEAFLRGNITFAGKGGMREVYIASYGGRPVAVKELIRHSRFAEHAHFLETIASDAVKGRAHVVEMLGFCGTTVVTEAYSKTVQQIVSRATEPLPIKKVVSISLDAAKGLEALHEAADAPIVHFDVNIDQLLVRDDGRVSLGDFNFAYFMGTSLNGKACPFNIKESKKRKRKMDKSRIMAPEFITDEPLTAKLDIYRMGLIYAEVLSAGGSTTLRAGKGGAPSFDPAWHQGYTKVVQDMLGEAERRPSATELVSRLQEIQEELRAP